MEVEIDHVSNSISEWIVRVDNDELVHCQHSSLAFDLFSTGDWWGDSDHNVPGATSILRPEADIDGERTDHIRSALQGSIGGALEAGGEVLEGEDGVVDTDDTELDGIVLAFVGGGG